MHSKVTYIHTYVHAAEVQGYIHTNILTCMLPNSKVTYIHMCMMPNSKVTLNVINILMYLITFITFEMYIHIHMYVRTSIHACTDTYMYAGARER